MLPFQQQVLRFLRMFLVTGLVFWLPGLSVLYGEESSIPRIHLSQEELDQAVRLDQEWAFARQQLLPPDQVVNFSETRRIGEIWPTKGFATYRIELSIPEGIDQIKLIFPRIQGGIKLWANDKLVAKRGEVSARVDENISKAGTLLTYVTVTQPILSLTLQLSSYHHRTPGSFHPPWVGSTSAIERIYQRYLISDSWMVGILMTMGLWNFIIFILNRRKSNGAFPFALLCFFIAMRLCFAGDAALIYSIFDMSFLWHYRLEYISFYLALAFLTSFINCLFPYALPKLMFRLVIVITSFFTLMTLFTKVEFFSEFLFVIQHLVILTAVVVFIGSLVSIKKKVYDSGFFVLSLVMFSLASINDILFYQKLIQSVLLTHYGFAGFLFFQSILISKRFTRAEKLDQEQRMTTDTIRKSQQVYESYISSLEKVPGVESRFFYRLADKTGGDWLVVHHSPDQDVLYLALGDVSGHGLNSALFTLSITSAVKQAFVGLASEMMTPERVMQSIHDVNETVLQAAELLQKHITVVFLAIDLRQGHCYYFNAGHCSIILSQKDRTKAILKPGSAIGMLPQLTIGYDRFSLSPGDSILLYTDGLVENGEERRQRIKVRELLNVMSFGKSINDYQQELSMLIEKKWHNQVHLEDDTTSLILQFSSHIDDSKMAG
ncbi:MAG: PP2C family protein-serine/threonine phosphatase [Oligoflexus sp.]